MAGGSTENAFTSEGKKIRKRETWTRKLDFLLSCIGFCVGLGNMWRFPFLCYKNGGGAFLIPYLFCVVTVGIPISFLEIAQGQYMRAGGVAAWKICPLFQGIGLGCLGAVISLNTYYVVVIAWSFFYLFSSFTSELPWVSCDHEWNTKHCRVDFGQNATNGTVIAADETPRNSTDSIYLADPVTEFWENKVLGISSGIDSMGAIKWDMALCLLLTWVIVFFCISKGIKTSGKVMYFMATSPYFFMAVLLIRGVTLPGAFKGILFYIKPNFSKVFNFKVWVDAGTQVIYSYATCLGALTALGSYNELHHNSYRHLIVYACMNSGTSILSGFIVFSVLGYMATEQGMSVQEVAESGPGLAFIAYPKAVATMPVAPLWSVFFFTTLILIGLDSQFVGVEAVITAIVDQFPKFLRVGYRREVFIMFVCATNYLMGLAMTANGGMYVFQLFDYYPVSRVIVYLGFLECMAIAWFYGVNKFYNNIRMMLGFQLSPFLKICWTVITPAVCLFLFIGSIVDYSELIYERPNVKYTYPRWAVGIGWSLVVISAIWPPVIAFYKLCSITGNWKKGFQKLIQPSKLQPHQLPTYEDDEYREQGSAELSKALTP